MSLVHPSGYGLVANIFVNVALLGHKFDEVLFLHIWLQLLQDCFKLRLVFIFSVVGIETHFSLHIVVVLGHKLAHTSHHVVFPLRFDRLLVVL